MSSAGLLRRGVKKKEGRIASKLKVRLPSSLEDKKKETLRFDTELDLRVEGISTVPSPPALSYDGWQANKVRASLLWGAFVVVLVLVVVYCIYLFIF
eukprot:gene12337-8465_t